MDYITRKTSLDQLKAHAQVLRTLDNALDHLSSDEFLALSEADRVAHAAAYRQELPLLERKIPPCPNARVKFHLLGTYLQLYE